MATQIITLRGEISWAKGLFEDGKDMFEFNEDTGVYDKPTTTDGLYSVHVALDMEEFRKLKRSGSKACANSKENEVGLDVVKLRRPHTKRGAGGKILEWASGAPKVVDAHDNPWDVETMGIPGNGSDAECTVAVYTTSYSPGTRLEKVKIITNIPYEPEDTATPKETASSDGEVNF